MSIDRKKRVTSEETKKKMRKPRLTDYSNSTARTYNMEYQRALLIKPENCEVCSIAAIDLKKGLYWDHDHKTGKFRGWLCVRCNTALGFTQDNASILRALADYLENNNQHKQDK